MTEHPSALAEQIAKLLESDPIAARQVREHLSDERLIELLELKPTLADVDLENEDDVGRLISAVDDCFSSGAFEFKNKIALLDLVTAHFTKADVLGAFAK